MYIAPSEAEEIRRILAHAPFAVAELLIGNVVVSNISVSNAFRVAETLSKRWRDAQARQTMRLSSRLRAMKQRIYSKEVDHSHIDTANVEPLLVSCMSAPLCARCKDQGFYYRLPRGMNPFASSIEVTARAMKRIKCDCAAWQGPSTPSTQA